MKTFILVLICALAFAVCVQAVSIIILANRINALEHEIDLQNELHTDFRAMDSLQYLYIANKTNLCEAGFYKLHATVFKSSTRRRAALDSLLAAFMAHDEIYLTLFNERRRQGCAGE